MQSELNIIANITDNQAIYRCEAQNSATDVPLIDKKTLSVHCKYEEKKNHDFSFNIENSNEARFVLIHNHRQFQLTKYCS